MTEFHKLVEDVTMGVFDTTAERDAFVSVYFPTREAGDTPGFYALNEDATTWLVVNQDRVSWRHFDIGRSDWRDTQVALLEDVLRLGHNGRWESDRLLVCRACGRTEEVASGGTPIDQDNTRKLLLTEACPKGGQS